MNKCIKCIFFSLNLQHTNIISKISYLLKFYCNQSKRFLKLCPFLNELSEQAKGYNVPDYPANPKNDEEAKIKETYAKVSISFYYF